MSYIVDINIRTITLKYYLGILYGNITFSDGINGKLVLASELAIYDRLKKARENKPYQKFNEVGRSRLLTNNKLVELGNELNSKHGATFTNKQMKEAIKNAMKK